MSHDEIQSAVASVMRHPNTTMADVVIVQLLAEILRTLLFGAHKVLSE